MATLQTTQANLDELQLKKRGWLEAIFASPVLWGGAMTAGFYAALPHLPMQRELAQRYFTGHPLAYIETSLFFLGIATLAVKLISFGRQKRGLQLPLINETKTETDDPVTLVTQLSMRLMELPRRLHNTFLVRRIDRICQYVRGHGSADNLYEHQKFLSELDGDHLHESYGLLRTITWAIPILGFLGTVMGITIAIANLAVNETEKLTQSLENVTSGLGVAFDTTTLALGLTLVLVFLAHWVEKAEQSIMHEVDELAFNRIGGWFPTAQSASGPLMQAEQQAAEQMLQQTEALVSQHSESWQANLHELRSRWAETMQTQQASLAEALAAGAAATLADHSEQLSSARQEMLGGYREISQEIAGMMSAQREAMQEQQQLSRELMDQQRQLLLDEITTVRDELKLQAEQITSAISASAETWNSQLSTASQAMTDQMSQLHNQGDLLSRIIEQEENLVRLQNNLSENLNAIRSVEAFDETLHNLSAAVHLLTVRTKAA